MKKIFTLLTALFAVMAVNAQIYKINAVPENGASITDIAKVTLTFGNDETGWKDLDKKNKLTVNGEEYSMCVAASSTNPDPNKGKVPTKGAYLKFTANEDCKLAAIVYINAAKEFQVIKDTKSGQKEALIEIAEKESFTTGANGGYYPTEAYAGSLTFAVEKGNDYYIYCQGSKIGIYGFVVTDNTTGGGDDPTPGGNDYTNKEIMDVASDAIQGKIATAIENPISLSSPNFFAVSQDKNVYPMGTNDAGAVDVLAADGEAITLASYIWEHNSGNMAFKAVSTPNTDAKADERWQKKGNGALAEDGVTWTGNEAMNVEGCEPKFLYGTGPKNGNPTASYKDFYEYNKDGDPVHRVNDGPYWEPGCGWVPVKGCFYEFTPSVEGSLKVALWVNKNLNSNPLYIVNAATMTPIAQNDVEIVGFMQNNTSEKNANDEQCGTNPYILNAEYKLVPAATPEATPENRPFFGYFTFKVEAGTKYMIFSSKSQPGIFGYQFSHNGTSGISDIVVEKAKNDAIYNIAGQRVSSSAKGLVIKNGKKYFVK